MTTEAKVTEEMIQQALKASGSVEIARSGGEKLSMRQGFELGMQYARHHQADDATVERAVMVCPQCEGEGGYPDGADEDACHTECTRCGGNGWIVDTAAIAAMREDR